MPIATAQAIPQLHMEFGSGERLNRERAYERNLERGKAIVMDAPQLYIDVDVEADGIAGYGSLLSIGALLPGVFGQENDGTFYRELKPSSDLWVPRQKEFCESHGLERERLMDEGANPATAMGEFLEWAMEGQKRIGKAGSVLVAFNGSFDYPLINLELMRAGIDSPFGVSGYCIKSLANVLSPYYDWSKTRKDQLPADIMPVGDFTHQALEDASYQQGMHYPMVGKIDGMMHPLQSTWTTI
jgi:hypothetical protein